MSIPKSKLFSAIWKAKAKFFGRGFQCRKPLRSATFFVKICGYENSEKIGENLLRKTTEEENIGYTDGTALFTDNTKPKLFAVLDAETNWDGKVMSIGIVIAENAENFPLVRSAYYVLTPQIKIGGMYDYAVFIIKKELTVVCERAFAVEEIQKTFAELNIKDIFAYNARFDRRCLSELSDFDWFDIMSLAAYRQYNLKIPVWADCYSTGKLKSGYGVQSILQMLGDPNYRETHNALIDAADELTLMRLLKHSPYKYKKIN